MALSFDGVDDQAVGTVSAITDSDYTMIAWIYPVTAGESSNGYIMAACISGSTPRHRFYMTTAGRAFGGQQDYTTTNATSSTNETLTASAWSCVAMTHRASDNTIRAFLGTQSAAMAEATYSSQTAGVGTFQGSAVDLRLGSRDTTVRTFDGRIGPCCYDNREWRLDEMERFRLGLLPIPTSTMRALYLLDSSVATQHADLSGSGATMTLVGSPSTPTWVDNPPVAFRWGDRLPITQTAPAAGGSSVPVKMDYYRRRRVA